ncbi:hypothetical protein CYMTET_42114 [Cymbomonas tetramitiformis]|uniref:Cyclic nucleotide-binding domain-containing protein n=1 Tax=Cymbomonas tetramitiformis TaxID=36881 RepID=A0AAE0F1V1_9CHLO|nr:hypothetical protein CYMTET_42114 [Cymbomonas tetramitiformis]
MVSENVHLVTESLVKSTFKYLDSIGKQIEKPATVLASISTLDVLPQYDAVAFLEDGQIAEYGSYAELMAKRQLFYRYMMRENAITLEADGSAKITGDGVSKSCWMLRNIDTASLSKIAGLFSTREVPKGEVIYMRGDACDAFYVVAKGQVAESFYTSLDEGEGPYMAKISHPMDSLCDRPLFAVMTENDIDDIFPSTAIAETDVTLLALHCVDFMAALEKNQRMRETIDATLMEMEHSRHPDVLQEKAWQLMLVNDKQVQSLTSLMQVQIMQRNTELCDMNTGSPLHACYIVVSGQVMVKWAKVPFLQDEEEPDPIILGPKGCFGEHLLGGVHPGSEPIEVTVLEDSVLLVMGPELLKAWRQGEGVAPAIDGVIESVAYFRGAEPLRELWPFANVDPEEIQAISQYWKPVVYNVSKQPKAKELETSALMLFKGGMNIVLQDAYEQMTEIVMELKPKQPPPLFGAGVMLGIPREARVVGSSTPSTTGGSALAFLIPHSFLQHGLSQESLAAAVAAARHHHTVISVESLAAMLPSRVYQPPQLCKLSLLAEHNTIRLAAGQKLRRWINTMTAVMVVTGEVAIPGGDTATAVSGVLSSTSTYDRNDEEPLCVINMEDEAIEPNVVVKRVSSGEVSAISDSTIAMVNLDAVAEEALANAEDLKKATVKSEKRRITLYHELKAAQRTMYELEVQLGLKRKLNVKRMYRKALFRVRFQLATTKANPNLANWYNIMTEIEADRYVNMPLITLQAVYDEAKANLQRMEIVKRDRVTELKSLWQQAEKVGLIMRQVTDDLSWRYLENLDKEIKERHEDLHRKCAEKYNEAELIFTHMKDPMI